MSTCGNATARCGSRSPTAGSWPRTILLATGRAPQTRDVGLESVGLTPGDWLAVDDTFQVTGVDGGWLYAVGDVNHRALMTHQGKYQARIAGTVIGARAKGEPIDDAPWGAHVATADHAAVPRSSSPPRRPPPSG